MIVSWGMIKEYVAGKLKGKDWLVVAGRAPNAGLVGRVAGVLQAATGLRVERIVRNDCG
jgi:hypothetical protein